MSLPVTTTFSNPNPISSPTTLTETVAILNTLVASSLNGSFTPYIIQSAVPTVEQQGYIWVKLTGAGNKPTGVYVYYGGAWRKIYTGLPSEIRMFSGDPAGYFDANGLGVVGADWDGWHLCNGKDGVIDLSDKFIVAAHMSNALGSGYAGGWKTYVTGSALATGGSKEATLDADTAYWPGHGAINLQRWGADGNTPATDGGMYGVSGTPSAVVEVQAAYAGNTSPDPFEILPPFYALAYAVFVGY